MRRKIIISLIVLILATAGILVYFLFFREGELTIPSFRRPSTGQPVGTSHSKSALIQISNFAVSSFGLSPDKSKVRFFERSSGNLHEAEFDGSGAAKISESVLPQNLIKVVWSKNWTQFAAVFEDPTKNFLYNFSTGRSVFFNDNVNAVDFAPNNSQVAYQTADSLIIGSVAAPKQGQTLLNGSFPNLNLVWLNNGLLSIHPAPSGLVGSYLILVNQNGRVTKLLDNLAGLSVSWAPDGSKLVLSHTQNSASPTLELANGFAQERRDLKLKTLADKCVWSADSKTIYCAVPDNWPNAAVEPDDYYKGLVQPKDRFVKIDSLTALSNIILETIDADAQDLLVTPQNDYLLFINRKDGKLYSLKL